MLQIMGAIAGGFVAGWVVFYISALLLDRATIFAPWGLGGVAPILAISIILGALAAGATAVLLLELGG